jgi:hypothetical protein
MESVQSLDSLQIKFDELVTNNIKRDNIDKLLMSLHTKTDFYTAPCSTKYHLNIIGGLLLHSINVLECLINVNNQFQLNLNNESMYLCGLFHDLCKANYYYIEKRNVKEDNKWIEKEVWAVNDKFPAGHGEKSCFILQHYISLKPDELLAIRWHMGSFEAGIPDSYSISKSFDNANKYSKLIPALQIADQLATNFLE